jgi:hypothetical protein
MIIFTFYLMVETVYKHFFKSFDNISKYLTQI